MTGQHKRRSHLLYRMHAWYCLGLMLLMGGSGIRAASPPGSLDFSPVAASERPHIILVMADDQGWGDTGYNGHPVLKTPALDDMAAKGYVFNRFYAAAPVCSPTRASVLTGRHPLRSKVPNHGRYMRGHLEQTLPRALKSAGYITGMFGKSHVGSGQPNSPVNPTGMGFDEWVIGLNFFDLDPYLSRNGVVEHRAGEQGSVVAMDETIAFLDAHKAEGKPMFAITWFPSPHGPHKELSSRPDLYAGVAGEGYFQEITLLDEQLGRLRRWLRRQQLDQNTLLWYCSDNGGLRADSSGGRGRKGDTWEGGLRVPGLLEWPVRSLRGSTDVPAVTSDIYPTLLALVGAQIDNPYPLDGINLQPIIEGRRDQRPAIGFWHLFQGGQSTHSDEILRDIMVQQHHGTPPPHNPVRIKKDVDEFPPFDEDLSTGNVAWLEWPWKLHRRNHGRSYQLYQLEEDPMEATDRVNDPDQAKRVRRMKKALHAWQAGVMRSLNGEDYAPVSVHRLPTTTTNGNNTQ